MAIHEVEKALFQRAMMLKADIRDGDGDGLINDGTPQERPVDVPLSMKQVFFIGRYDTQD